MSDRIIVLVDMDCFYCQVEARYDPSLKGKPMAVVQYNQWQGGGIIAVNYEARAFGVTRHIRGNEAKKKCPQIKLVHVPSIRGKADLTRYREAGREVVDVLCRFCDTVQRASVDEAYLDITQTVNARYKELKGTHVKSDELKSTFIVGFSPEDSNDEEDRKKGVMTWLNRVYQDELQDETAEKLTIAALLVEEMRAAVYETTGFRCSAGIAHNKILAKLACGIHKPQRQTILPQTGVPILYHTLPLKKIRGLGGKFGDMVMQRLNITYMGELQQFSEAQLQKIFDEKSGTWLFNIAQGFDDEAVTSKLTSKSIGCCKKFPGKLALNTKETVEHWLSELAEEVGERLEKELSEGNRRASQFVVSYMQTIDGRDVSASRCGPLVSLEPKQMVLDAMELLKRSNTAPSESAVWYPPLKFLGLSAGKFIEKDSKSKTIENFFKLAPKEKEISLVEGGQTIHENLLVKSNENPLTPENAPKEENMKSSGKKSFFLRFFKQEGLIKTPSSSKVEKVADDNKNEISHEGKGDKQEPTGTSQQATTSEGIAGITNRALRLLQVDESSNDSDKPIEHWVSPGEIFPNLDEVDDDVAALLPSPLQRQLRTRIQKHQEAKNVGKNKGCGKGKSRKCLEFNVIGTSAVTDNNDTGFNHTKTIINDVLAASEEKESCDLSEQAEKRNEEESYPNVSQEDIFASDSSDLKEKSDVEVTELPHISSNIGRKETHSKPNKSNENSNGRTCNSGELNCIPIRQDAHSIFENSASDSEEILEVGEILKELCPHCNQLISLQEYPEHLDFHVATDLDKEINKVPLPQNTSCVNKSPGNSPRKDVGKRKRGRPGTKQNVPATDKKMKSITAFFAPVR
ncbi:Putative DNA polymerase eta [Gryllus bimaculatus]|nr:Putative DNA polymerase eta [Gryllus bimaculatus]